MRYSKIIFMASAFLAGAMALIGLASPVYAETIVSGGAPPGANYAVISTSTTWTREGSPYRLPTTTIVDSGSVLTLEPGTSVEPMGPNVMSTLSIEPRSSIRMMGEPENRVKITLDTLYIKGTSTVGYIRNSDITGSTFLLRGNLDAASTSFKGGIFFLGARAKIRDSRKENGYGGIVFPDFGRTPSFIDMKGSIIRGNEMPEVVNRSGFWIGLEDNWWGSSDGPAALPAGEIDGPIRYSPWLTKEPALDFGDSTSTQAECCSSILFIPGLQASRLYSGTNRVWEPNSNADALKLFMNEDGSPTDASIYSGGPIDKALRMMPVYQAFMSHLDSLVEKGTIKEWKSFGYDWRRSVAEVVAGPEKKATNTESLIGLVEQMAERSPTGKVTIVAHSNGGLVTKYLIKELSQNGKEGLIDSVISVAVPYLGTPKALLSLLHGDDQSIGFGLILKKSIAMNLGLNMPSAYSLIPSAEYFMKALGTLGPTVAYAGSNETLEWDSAPPLGSPEENVRAQSSLIRSLANGALWTGAELLHGLLDPFYWPSSIARWAIVGWGNETASGVQYKESEPTRGSDHSALVTTLGDSTVVVPSAAYGSGTTTALDLPAISGNEGSNIRHVNILEASSTQAAIDAIVTRGSASAPGKNAKEIEEAISRIPGASIGVPGKEKESALLFVSTHSPVELHVYDESGRHTGIIPVPADLGVEEGLYTMFESNIPGSNFEFYGSEDSPNTHISIPMSKMGEYVTEVRGIGVGEFTYKVEKIQAGRVLESVTYSGLPSTPIMTATSSLVLDGTGHIGGAASSTLPISIDVNGDGGADIQSGPGELSPAEFFKALALTVRSLGSGYVSGAGEAGETDQLIKRIDELGSKIDKEKFKSVLKAAKKVEKSMGHKKLSTLTQEERALILSLIDELIKKFE